MPATALAKIPPGTGVLTVMRSDQLAGAQAGVRAVKVLSTALLVLVLALYALAIYLAGDERRQAIRNIGCAFLIVGLTVLVVRRVAGNYAIDALTAPAGEQAGKRAWLIGSEILAQIGWATILYGLIALAGAVLAGPTRAATSVRAGSLRSSTSARASPGRGSPSCSCCSSQGPHACVAYRLGHRAARRADRARRPRAAPADAA